MLEGFKPVILSKGFPSISITENGITFNKNSIMKLDEPEHVILYINEEKKQIAVAPSSIDEAASIPFLKRGKKNISVRWNNRDLLSTISRLMNWNFSSVVYRVDGEFFKEHSLLVFDLTKFRTTNSENISKLDDDDI